MRPVRVDGALYTVGPVRVRHAVYTVGPLACLHCFRQPPELARVYGIVDVHCRGCRKRWHAVRLPPWATGQHLIEVYGRSVARALHREFRPDDDGCSDDALALFPVPVSREIPTFLQRMADRGEPAMEWHRARTIFTSLMK
jgi:hypothetical protein